MLNLLFGISPLYKFGVAAVAGLMMFGGIYMKGRSDGYAKAMTRLAADRVQILKDGQDITNEIRNSDDDVLCDVLGGCAD